jgi:hypothetical protein
MGDITESGAKTKTRGVLEGAKESLLGSGDDDEGEGSSRSRSRAATRRR